MIDRILKFFGLQRISTASLPEPPALQPETPLARLMRQQIEFQEALVLAVSKRMVNEGELTPEMERLLSEVLKKKSEDEEE